MKDQSLKFDLTDSEQSEAFANLIYGLEARCINYSLSQNQEHLMIILVTI